MISLRQSLEKLSDKYSLSNEEIVASIEKVVSTVMARVTKKDADFHLDRGEIHIYDTNKQVIQADSINKSIMRLIKSMLIRELYLKSVINEHEAIIRLNNSVIGGYVSRISADGSIYIEAENGDRVFYGVCKRIHQTPKERNKYKLGQYYSFYVNKITLSCDHLANEVSLSRTSKNLVSGLLQEALLSRFIEDIQVVCKRRIAGIASEVIASKKMPKDCIVAVSRELKERIVVKF